MCVLGGEIGKDSCKGDSGGGLYIQVKILNVFSCIMVVLYGRKNSISIKIIGTNLSEGAVQGLVSHWNCELWKQEVWKRGAWHLHKGERKKGKMK